MKLTIDTEKKVIKLKESTNLVELFNWVDDNLGGVNNWTIITSTHKVYNDWVNITKPAVNSYRSLVSPYRL
jgi:hypothetical protein